MEYLLEHKASLNAVDSSADGGMSALMLACVHKRTALTAARQAGLSKSGASNSEKAGLQILEAWARDDVRIAAESGNMKALRVFMPQDIEIDEPLDTNARTALSFAAQHGHLEMCKWLGNPAVPANAEHGHMQVQGASVNAREKKDHRSPL